MEQIYTNLAMRYGNTGLAYICISDLPKVTCGIEKMEYARLGSTLSKEDDRSHEKWGGGGRERLSLWIWPAVWAWKQDWSANQSFLQKSFKDMTFYARNAHGKVNTFMSNLCDAGEGGADLSLLLWSSKFTVEQGRNYKGWPEHKPWFSLVFLKEFELLATIESHKGLNRIPVPVNFVLYALLLWMYLWVPFFSFRRIIFTVMLVLYTQALQCHRLQILAH